MSGASPISRFVDVRRLPKKGMPVTIVADEAQRNDLAAGHGLVEVRRFEADLLVAPWKGNGVRITGRVDALVSQQCVATLDPLDARVNEAVDSVFLPRDSRLVRPEDDGALLIDPEGPDAPEPFSGDTIDAGALAEEIFELGIDPYPRREGAVAETHGEEDGQAREGPLAVQLRALKGRSDD